MTMLSRLRRAALAGLSAALLALAPAPAAAQGPPVRPHLEWRTVRTEHFDVHYPREMEAWARDFAARLEPVHERVAALVGSAPAERVTVVVEDPSVQTNAFAFSLPGTPAIVVWPTPPDPHSHLSAHRGAGEQLAIHEYAHLAHLLRPSRNPRERLLGRLLPFRMAPLGRNTPRWVREGYATWVEGRLTGSGRPHGVLRAAVLRQWALEGRLPSYGELSGSGRYQGGSMAYLAGSAFLEWLAEREGEESLVRLWRRLSARQDRSFAEAFAGVYGGYPHDLYGRFTVEVTEGALAARGLLRAFGLEVGDTVQALSWGTGDPALSPDGERVAMVLRGAPGRPSRLVVQSTTPQPDSLFDRARARLLAADPEDVPAVEWRPRPLRTLATLRPVEGRGHESPRFLPGGDEVLVTRWEPLGDGALRPDLFVWRWRTGALRRVTRGASIVSADPAPDGRSAAGVRCEGGICDLVRVDLRTGDVRTLAAGSPTRVFARPRVSADGRTVAVAVHEDGRWRVALADFATGALRSVGPRDGASRYDPAWLPGGELAIVSESGGVANLARLDPATGTERPLTRVTGAALAPDADPRTGAVWHLSLHAEGMDLMRVQPDSVTLARVVPLPPSLRPAAPPAPPLAETIPRAPLPPSRAYGIGPRGTRWLPDGAAGADGASVGALLLNVDPVGRLSVLARGRYGWDEAPSGASLQAVWRGWRPEVGAEVAWMRRPVDHDVAPAALGADLAAATAYLEHAWRGGASVSTLRLGGSAGRLDFAAGGDQADRVLGFGEWSASAAGTRGGLSLGAGLRLSGAAGRTAGETWRRGTASADLRVRLGPLAADAAATYGRVTEDAPAWERFAVGGLAVDLLDPAVLGQHLAMPGLPHGVRTGDEVLVLRAAAPLAGTAIAPFYWAATVDGGERWLRVVGAETSFSVGPAALIRLPGTRAVAGVAYALDPPVEHHLRAYAGVSFRP